jgi:hypothetical protein
MSLSPRSFLLASALAACVVISGVWLYCRLMPMHFLGGGYPIWVAKQAMLHDCRLGSILVLGDSRPEAAIVPADLPLPAANIAFSATTPIETYFFAREALKCSHLPRLVVYSHSVLTYVHPNERLWTIAARYGSVGFRDLRDIAAVAARDHDRSLADVNTHDGLTGIARDAVYGIGFPSIFAASLIDARGIGRYEDNKALFERTAMTRGQVVFNQPPEKRLVGVDADAKEFVPSPLETDYFDATLALFAAAHARVLLLTVPVGASTDRAIPAGAKADFTRYLTAHVSRYDNIVLGPADVYGWPDEFYVDGSHMNQRGAKIFTARLASCLRQWGDDLDHPTPCDLGWK